MDVFADYHQFSIWDAGVEPLAPEDYTDHDVRRRAAVAPNVVVVEPLRNTTVPIDLEIHAWDPDFEDARGYHIAEGSLDLVFSMYSPHLERQLALSHGRTSDVRQTTTTAGEWSEHQRGSY